MVRKKTEKKKTFTRVNKKDLKFKKRIRNVNML